MLNRRDILYGLGALPLVRPAAGLAATEVTLGETVLTSVSDGNLVLPGDMVFEHLPQDTLMPILQATGVARDQVTPPSPLTLLRQSDRLVLFDAGSGPGFMPSAGSILDSLDAVGVAADEITHVIFTHAHPDHLWGVLDDFDEPVFYEAQHMMAQPEWDYWSDPHTVNTIGEMRASFAAGAARRLEMMAEQFSFFGDGEEVVPGVMAHLTPGHTPGHTAFEVRDGSTAIMIGGDAIVNHHVAMARPEWPSGSDQDPEAGAATRLRLLDQLVTDDIALMGFHLPGGGLGRVEKAGDGYRFVPEVA